MLRKILVVDDSELLHRMYDLVLMRYRHAGASVLHARNGSEAVSLIHQHNDVQLVLLDINMPVMGGLQVLNGLRLTGRLQNLAVIMVSTEGHEADMERALASGASGYVTKPFTPAQLHDLIAARFSTTEPALSGIS